jgi:hypothetical protein
MNLLIHTFSKTPKLMKNSIMFLIYWKLTKLLGAISAWYFTVHLVIPKDLVISVLKWLELKWSFSRISWTGTNFYKSLVPLESYWNFESFTTNHGLCTCPIKGFIHFERFQVLTNFSFVIIFSFWAICQEKYLQTPNEDHQ